LGNGWDSSTKRHPRPAPAKHLRESVPKIDPKTVWEGTANPPVIIAQSHFLRSYLD
jgi:hypothetical protein